MKYHNPKAVNIRRNRKDADLLIEGLMQSLKRDIKALLDLESSRQEELQAKIRADFELIMQTALSREAHEYDESIFKKVTVLKLSTRARKCLQSGGITYIGDLVRKSPYELWLIPKVGRVSIAEIENELNRMGLCFGMIVPNWDEIRPRS